MSKAKVPSAITDPVALLEMFRKKNPDAPPADPIGQILFAILAENTDVSLASAAFRRLVSSFVNLNELRAARWCELARLIDPLPNSDERAMAIRDMLNRIVEYAGALDLSFFETMKISEAKKLLEKIAPTLPQPAAQIILFSLLPSAHLSLSEAAIDLGRKNGWLGITGKEDVAKRLLKEGKISRQEIAHLFFYLEIAAGVLPGKRPRKKPIQGKKKESSSLLEGDENAGA